MFVGIIISVVIGFVVGILVGRNNPAMTEGVIAKVKAKTGLK